jgi:hypothetical protein
MGDVELAALTGGGRRRPVHAQAERPVHAQAEDVRRVVHGVLPLNAGTFGSGHAGMMVDSSLRTTEPSLSSTMCGGAGRCC